MHNFRGDVAEQSVTSPLLLYNLANNIPHRISRLPHHLRRGVGVGAQREPRAVVPQSAGQSFYIHAVLQGQRCEGVSEIMESNVLRADGLEDLLMGMPEGIGVEHPASLG